MPIARRVPSRMSLINVVICKQISTMDGLIAMAVFYNFKGSILN